MPGPRQRPWQHAQTFSEIFRRLTAFGRDVAAAEAERLEKMVRAARGVKLLGAKS